jgi:hypothetical protein
MEHPNIGDMVAPIGPLCRGSANFGARPGSLEALEEPRVNAALAIIDSMCPQSELESQAQTCCWEAWHAARKREAAAALKAMGVGKSTATEWKVGLGVAGHGEGGAEEILRSTPNPYGP